MKVIFSSKTSKNKRIYHKSGCIYEKRIKADNKTIVTVETAKAKGYCECKYCGGLKGEIRVHAKELNRFEKNRGLKAVFDDSAGVLLIATKIAKWKIRLNRYGEYILWHANYYIEDSNFIIPENTTYHKQRDVKAGCSFNKIIQYIMRHDEAKVIIAKDYRKLPKKTKKQKKYFRQAERRHRAKRISTIEALFEWLESKDPELKKYAIY